MNLFHEESGGERFESLIEKIVLRSTDGELQAVDSDDDLEDGRFVFVSQDEVYSRLYDDVNAISKTVK